jgi:hypothetical protein
MKCKDFRELLSAYSDGELDDERRKIVETHLENCITCRLVLDEFNNTREKLLLLQQNPPIHDIRETAMASIKHYTDLPWYHNWLRPAAIVAPVIIILAVVLSIQFTGIFSNTSSVLAKTYVAIEDLSSFQSIRDEYFQYSQSGTLFQTAHGEIKYISPNRYQLVCEIRMPDAPDFPFNMEMIRVGNQVYIDQPWLPFEFDEEWFDKQVPTKEKTLEYLDLLIEVEKLDEEEIDGTDCYHYIGTIDIKKYIERSRPGWKKLYTELSENMGTIPEGVDRFIERLELQLRDQELTYELWIGKKDYLIRKSRYTSQQSPDSNNSQYSISECTYFGFNEELIIEAPLDESGELLSGWTSYTLGE